MLTITSCAHCQAPITATASGWTHQPHTGDDHQWGHSVTCRGSAGAGRLALATRAEPDPAAELTEISVADYTAAVNAHFRPGSRGPGGYEFEFRHTPGTVGAEPELTGGKSLAKALALALPVAAVMWVGIGVAGYLTYRAAVG